MAWAFLRLILLIGSAIPLALRQAGVWKAPPQQLLVLCLLVIAAVGAGEPFFVKMRDGAKRMAAEELERTRQLLLMALVEIAHLVSLPCQDVGIHLFVVKNRFPKRFRDPVLERKLRVRLSSVPVSSDVTWTRGKGVVGACWQQQRDHVVDLDGLHSAHYDIDAEAWDRLPASVTLGLTFQDFERTRAKYGMVVATPMTRPLGGVVGVVAVDGPCGRSSALDTGPVKGALRRVADDLQRHLNR